MTISFKIDQVAFPQSISVQACIMNIYRVSVRIKTPGVLFEKYQFSYYGVISDTLY